MKKKIEFPLWKFCVMIIILILGTSICTTKIVSTGGAGSALPISKGGTGATSQAGAQTTLNIPKTVTLSGGITGNGTLDGNGNISIPNTAISSNGGNKDDAGRTIYQAYYAGDYASAGYYHLADFTYSGSGFDYDITINTFGAHSFNSTFKITMDSRYNYAYWKQTNEFINPTLQSYGVSNNKFRIYLPCTYNTSCASTTGELWAYISANSYYGQIANLSGLTFFNLNTVATNKYDSWPTETSANRKNYYELTYSISSTITTALTTVSSGQLTRQTVS